MIKDLRLFYSLLNIALFLITSLCLIYVASAITFDLFIGIRNFLQYVIIVNRKVKLGILGRVVIYIFIQMINIIWFNYSLHNMLVLISFLLLIFQC